MTIAGMGTLQYPTFYEGQILKATDLNSIVG